MSVKIAHRRNVFLRDHEWYDTLTNVFSFISARQWGYSHSELLFSDGVAFSSLFTIKEGESLIPESAHPKGGLALFRRPEGYKDDLWRFTTLPMDAHREAELRMACENLTREEHSHGTSYDRAGVLRFVFPWMKAHEHDYFCSEAVYTQVHGVCKMLREVPAHKVSPNLLTRLCEEWFVDVTR